MTNDGTINGSKLGESREFLGGFFESYGKTQVE